MSGISKRPFINSDVLRDWVFWTALALACLTLYSDSSSTTEVARQQHISGADGIASSLDAIVTFSIAYAVNVLVIGLIRRKVTRDKHFEESTSTFKRSLLILGSPVVIALLVHLLSTVNAESEMDSSKSYLDESGFEIVPRTCQPQGEDEKCISGLGTKDGANLTIELNYKSLRVVDGFEILSSTWNLNVDCLAKSTSVSNLKFFLANGTIAPVRSEVVQLASDGLQADSTQVLENCN